MTGHHEETGCDRKHTGRGASIGLGALNHEPGITL